MREAAARRDAQPPGSRQKWRGRACVPAARLDESLHFQWGPLMCALGATGHLEQARTMHSGHRSHMCDVLGRGGGEFPAFALLSHLTRALSCTYVVQTCCATHSGQLLTVCRVPIYGTPLRYVGTLPQSANRLRVRGRAAQQSKAKHTRSKRFSKQIMCWSFCLCMTSVQSRQTKKSKAKQPALHHV